MIVSSVRNRGLRSALEIVARSDEDVVVGEATWDAVRHGFPRLLVQADDALWDGPVRDAAGTLVPILSLSSARLGPWRRAWRHAGVAQSWPHALASRIRPLCSTRARRGRAERALGDLARLTGGPLPPGLRAFGRRVMERPLHYSGLESLAAFTGVSSGALKARFRRRDLSSPFTYLRWFRCLAVAELLRDGQLNTQEVARSLGWSSTGNLCRYVQAVTDMTPTELRRPDGWEVMLVRFVRQELDADALSAWRSLDTLMLSGTG